MCFERLETFMLALLPLLRSIMAAEEIPLDALIIYPNTILSGSNDNNESAGVALITRDQAFLWTESNLFSFPSKEFSEKWIVHDSRSESMKQWIVENLPPRSVVGFEPYAHSIFTVLSWTSSFVVPKDMELVPVELGHTWMNARNIFPDDNTADSMIAKQTEIKNMVEATGICGIVTSNPNDVSKLYGLKASHIPKYPVATVAAVTRDSCFFFVHDIETLPETAIQHFSDHNILVREFIGDLSSDLRQLGSDLIGSGYFGVNPSAPYIVNLLQ